MAKIPIVLIALVVALGLCWAAAEGPLRDPEDALHDFYEAHQRAEDQLIVWILPQFC